MHRSQQPTPVSLSPALAADKARLTGLMTALAKAHGLAFDNGSVPARYIGQQHRATLTVASLTGGDPASEALRLRFTIIRGRLGLRVMIIVTQEGENAFSCSVNRFKSGGLYEGDVPAAEDGQAMDEAAFLAFAERCLAFFRGLSERQPIDPGAVYRLGSLIMEERRMPLTPASSSVGEGVSLLSPSKDVTGGWKARFALPADERSPYPLAYVISRSGTVGTPEEPGFIVSFRPCRSGHEGSDGHIFLRYETSCREYDGPRPELPADCRDLEAAEGLLCILADFHEDLPVLEAAETT